MDELVEGLASTLEHADEKFAVAPKGTEKPRATLAQGVAIIQVAPRMGGRGNAVGYFSDMLRAEGFKPELEDEDDNMVGFATPEGYNLSIDVIRSNRHVVQVGCGIAALVKTLGEAAEACTRVMLGHPFIKCAGKDDAGRLQVVLTGNGFVGAASDPRLNFRNLVAAIHAASRTFFKANEELEKTSRGTDAIQM